MKECKKCKCLHNNKGTYCSRKCANSRVWSKEDKEEKKISNCIVCNTVVVLNKRASILECRCDFHRKERSRESVRRCLEKKVASQDLKKERVCKSCKTTFKSFSRKTCSRKCQNELQSKVMSKKAALKGTNNWKTKRESFTYKFVKDICIDSRLEQAAIIYLVDVLKVDKIEKYRNILQYKENNKHKAFNPDFYVRKGNEVYIVEVKMQWSKSAIHIYNRAIPFKREALRAYCEKKGYKMIWLDFSYDKKLKKIYCELCK